ncbi:hypothetical protein [Streptomyces sp. NPDC005476]
MGDGLDGVVEAVAVLSAVAEDRSDRQTRITLVLTITHPGARH